jgi:hypothetical protein
MVTFSSNHIRGSSLKTALVNVQAGNSFHPTVLTATIVRICWHEPVRLLQGSGGSVVWLGVVATSL